MKSFEFVVKEAVGIHARPATQLVTNAATYKSNVTIDRNGKLANAKSMLAIMGLGAKCGDKVIFMIEGEDEETASSQLEAFCNQHL